MRDFSPHYDFKCTIILLIAIFLLLLSLGLYQFFETAKLNSFQVRYDDECKNVEEDAVCALSLTLDSKLVNPKVYYKINNFYANHQNFIKSKSYDQLASFSK